jgi:hypothetical protein
MERATRVDPTHTLYKTMATGNFEILLDGLLDTMLDFFEIS